jgi:hypothetical protein
MASDLRAAYAARNAQAATKGYSKEQPSKMGDYSAQRQLDHRVSESSGRIISKAESQSQPTRGRKETA